MQRIKNDDDALKYRAKHHVWPILEGINLHLLHNRSISEILLIVSTSNLKILFLEPNLHFFMIVCILCTERANKTILVQSSSCFSFLILSPSCCCHRRRSFYSSLTLWQRWSKLPTQQDLRLPKANVPAFATAWMCYLIVGIIVMIARSS